jgi:methionine synthase II (cobalamin-independent)
MTADLARTNAEAMRLMARSCGRHLRALPSGELEDDAGWAADRLEEFARLPGVKTVKKCRLRMLSYLGAPIYVVRRGENLNPDDINLHYVERAATNFSDFKVIRSQPELSHLKYQVCIINPIDLAWLGFFGSRRALEAFKLATWREVNQLADLVGGGNVTLQVDTPVSNIAANLLAGNDDVIGWFARMLQDLVAGFPAGVETGVHLCDGRYKGRPLGPALLYGMRPMAKIALAIGQHVADLRYIHAPVIAGMHRPRKPGSFYEGLEILQRLPDSIDLYLGMVHPDEPLLDQFTLLRHLRDRVGKEEVGVAFTCGLASMDGSMANRTMVRMRELVDAG